MRVLLVFGFLALVSCQLPSPCPEVLRYEPREKDADRWHAIITVKSSVNITGIWLQITLDEPADILLNWFGESTTSDNKDYQIKNEDQVLQAGKDFNIKIAVKFNKVNIIPSITIIKLNDEVICSSEVKSPSAAIISGGSDSNANQVKKNTSFLRGNEPEEEICGTVPLRGRPLIFNGQKADKGRWPWHVALVINEGEKVRYICGGSLISTNYVVTAAHCVTKSGSKFLTDVEKHLVYLGINDFRNFGAAFQVDQIIDAIVHPEYDPAYFYNDIALLKLFRAVIITDYVRPICLWGGDVGIDRLIGKLGTVVGWGVDGTSFMSKILNEASMPVVSSDTCIYSDRRFFSVFTSEKTYCAGYRNGTTVCMGDSGGGMVFPKAGSTPDNPIWELRGLVSVSYHTTEACETEHYVVFTDVAKHAKWIKSTAKLE